MSLHHQWQPRLWLRRLGIGVGLTVAILALASDVLAGNYSFGGTVPVTLEGSGITVQILSGSSADQFDIQSTTLTVTVAGGETFTLRYPGPAPGTLANDGGLSSCNNVGGNNDVTVTGPRTVTFTPNATACSPPASGGGGGGGGGNVSPTVTVSKPNGGETVNAGETYGIFWSAGGTQVTHMRILLSTDGGATWPTLLADNEPNDGHYAWAVPVDMPAAAARIKVEAMLVGGAVGASDTSDNAFTIAATAAAVVPAETIDEDKSLEPPPPEEPVQPLCIGGSLIKGPLPAVYFCGSDGRRYVFPNQQTYFSWYADFKSVVTTAPDVLAKIPLGGNVTYRPGSLVKVQTDPKVYVVSKGGTLRWVTTEEIAIALFGPNWNKLVHDVPDVFFINYVIGPPITSTTLASR